ncbi:MAG: hypothetical protein DWP94_04840 [Flavobacterium sp.]|nr:MAG: hypothetical protein DWP94_04840 [Flavobacterium sp.]
MFKRVLAQKGFWRSVVSLALAFAILFVIIKWAIEGFSMAYFTEQNPLYFLLGILVAGLVYGFFVTFGKFRAKLKKEDLKK